MTKEITYLKRSLSAKEEILDIAELHWINYVFPTIMAIFGLFSIVFSLVGDPADFILTSILFVICSLYYFLRNSKTEYIVTNKRVVSKTGIIAVKTEEIRNPKVESFNIDQGIFGRIFEYADLEFTGTGTQRVKFKNIKDPIGTKRRFETIVESNKKD